MADPSVESTYGAAFIGCVVAGVFYGFTCIQMYNYFKAFHDDLKTLRAIIAFLWFLDTLHILFVTWAVYFYMIKNSQVNVESTHLLIWPTGAVILVSNLSDFLVRIVFLYRIWHLMNKRLMLVVVLGVISTATTGFGMAYGIRMLSIPINRNKTFSWLLYTGLSSAALSDSLIAMTLCILFRRLHAQVESAHTLLKSLMIYSINTGVLPSMLAMATLITYATMPDRLIYMATFFVLPAASLNSLLATLNARTQLRHMFPSPALLKMLDPGSLTSPTPGHEKKVSHSSTSPLVSAV